VIQRFFITYFIIIWGINNQESEIKDG